MIVSMENNPIFPRESRWSGSDAELMVASAFLHLGALRSAHGEPAPEECVCLEAK
jgi:hypothetical protein